MINQLNAQQRAAVKYLDGPLLVLAGAGSGKTRVITQKIAYLIKQCAYPAASIAAVTFTNKAATEMRQRVASSIEPALRRGLKIATFHTLGLRMIKRDVSVCGLARGFSIFDAEDCAQLLKGFLPASHANDRDYVRDLQQCISHWKSALYTPQSIPPQDAWQQRMPDAPALYARYHETLTAYNAVDFDDLIRLPVVLLTQHPEILAYWQKKIRYLLVDEYQDSNECQYTFVKQLVGVRGQLTVVGDDDQSIYAWRGARPENLVQLQQDYPHLKLIKLEQNYRSTGGILHAANQLIAHNPHLFEKKLWSELGQGDQIRVLCCKDELDEAEQAVCDLISHKLRTRGSFGHYAILYRQNHQSRVVEKVLRQQGIPYRISGGQSWFARSEIKDVMAYIKLLCNPLDDQAFLRVIQTPKRGLGEKTLHALTAYARERGQSLYQCADHMALLMLVGDKAREGLQRFKQWFEGLGQRLDHEPTDQVLRDMIQDSGYEAYLYEQADQAVQAQKRMEQVWELLAWIARLMEKKPQATLNDIVNQLLLIDLLSQADDEQSEEVQLMTLHAAKGLEFPYVYLIGLEEDLLPHRVSIDENQIEEERRLMYVGMTRAQKGLCLTYARRRRRGGELVDCVPSRFLEELPTDLLAWYGRQGERDEQQSKALAQSHLDGLRELLRSGA